MMTNIIYDTLDDRYSFANSLTYIACGLIIVAIGAFFIAKEGYAKGDYTKSLSSTLVSIACVFLALLYTSSNIELNDRYKKLVHRIRSANYKVIKGDIRNFKPIDKFAKKEEAFSVNGVTFKYFAHMTAKVFHSVKGQGGGNPMKEGLDVKIRYYFDKNANRNFILKLEITDS